MKKIYTIFIMIISLICFSGCSNNKIEENIDTEENKISIITTIFPPYDFAKQIGEDKIDVKMLLKPGEESHSYEPTPKDIKDIQEADLFIYVGGENDVWVEDILNSMGENKPDTLKLLDSVPTLEEEIVEGMEDSHQNHDHDEEHEHEEEHTHDEEEHAHNEEEHAHNEEEHTHNEEEHTHNEEEHTHNEEEHAHDEEEHDEEHNHNVIDEHVWTSPKNAILIVQEITKIICEKDSENTEFYNANSEKYIEQLEELDSKFREVVSNSTKKTMIFGDRFPFRYFANEYGLNYYAAFSGCSTETEASPKTIAFLIDKVKENEINTVFTIEFSNGKIADSIVDSTDAKKMTFNSCHNLTKEQLENGATYLSLMEENVETLKEALN
ncbi:MAG: metal ABC transporter substrate-binding protein [Eubacteriales bacterium]|nr:metal ABC transporter substrate-binding protein [Eubacteriales bacterium]